MRVSHYPDLFPQAHFSVTENLIIMAKTWATISAVSHSRRKNKCGRGHEAVKEKNMGLRSILFTSPHPWMELEARSRGSGTSSATGNSEGSLVQELSSQTPIQIGAGSRSKATGHGSGSTNRFPSQLPRDAEGPGVRRRSEPALPRAATLPGPPQRRRPFAPLRDTRALRRPGRGRALPCAADLLTVRLSREPTVPSPKRPRVRPTEAPRQRVRPRGVAGQGRAPWRGGGAGAAAAGIGARRHRPAGRGGGGGGRRSAARTAESWRGSARRSLKMAAAEPGAAPGGGGCAPAGGGSVPVLFCFSVFARPASVPHGAGYELLIQKFLSLYGDQIDMHRKFVVQLFAEEWSQYIDLPKGFLVNERCKVRLVPLQIQVSPGGAAAPAATGACEGGSPARPAGRGGGPAAGGDRGRSPLSPRSLVSPWKLLFS